MKIPKIIHYFYDDVNPWSKGKNPQFRMCLYSWKTACPDYAFMLWHDRSPEFRKILDRSLFVRTAYKLKLWAFVSDYVRLYALHKYGGVYLDTDVQLLQNFDGFLNDGFFISAESDIRDQENIPEPAVMGSAPGHPLLEETMKLYHSKHIFELKNPTISTVMKMVLKNMTGFARLPYSSPSFALKAEAFYLNGKRIDDFELYLNQQCYLDEQRQVSVYPSRCFCPAWCVFGEKAVTEETVAIHWNQSSWWQEDVFKKLRTAAFPPPPAPVLPPPGRQSVFCLFKIPLLKIYRSPRHVKISCIGLFKAKVASGYFKLSFIGWITLLKIVRKN